MGCKKKINISFVVPLSTRSIAAIFIRNFPERVGRNGDSAKFLSNFKQDAPDLIASGIAASDMPILLDQLMYGITDSL